MSAFQYFHRRIMYGPCPRCGQPTAVGFAGEDPAPPTTCTRCIARDVARAYAETAHLGPCARCHEICTRYGDHGSTLCPGCQPLLAQLGDGTG